MITKAQALEELGPIAGPLSGLDLWLADFSDPLPFKTMEEALDDFVRWLEK